MTTIRRDKCEEGHERQLYAVYMSFFVHFLQYSADE